MSYFGNGYYRQQYQLRQQKQQKEPDRRCTKNYITDDNYIDFKQIKEDFDIGGIFDYFGMTKYLNDAESKKQLFIKKCSSLTSNDKRKDNCKVIAESRTKAYKVAYNILSTYLKKKTLKRITKVADKPYKVDRITKLACSLRALSNLHSNTNLCQSSSDRFKSLTDLIKAFTDKFKDNDNMYKLSEIFIKSIINNESQNQIIEVLNQFKDDKNNKQFMTALYDLIEKLQPCPAPA
jgi:hypothetical protein